MRKNCRVVAHPDQLENKISNFSSLLELFSSPAFFSIFSRVGVFIFPSTEDDCESVCVCVRVCVGEKVRECVR